MSKLTKFEVIGMGFLIGSLIILNIEFKNDIPKISDNINFQTVTERYTSMIQDGFEIQQQRLLEQQQKEEEERLLQEELEHQKQEEESNIEQIYYENEPQYTEMDFTLTFYTCLPSENSGYTTTAWGEVPTYGMVASNVYERGTRIYLEGYGEFVVADRGGSNFDNYNRLDVFIPRLYGESDEEYSQRVYSLGVVNVKGYIY